MDKPDSAKVVAERELLDAAFYIGSKQVDGQEYQQAVTFLRYMAETNSNSLKADYARELLNRLLELSNEK